MILDLQSNMVLVKMNVNIMDTDVETRLRFLWLIGNDRWYNKDINTNRGLKELYPTLYAYLTGK